MTAAAPGPVLLVSTGGTLGGRTAVAQLADGLHQAGAAVATVAPRAVPEVRTLMLTDLVQAAAARRLAARAIERLRPAAVIYCSITAALLWPRPGAIWLDSLAAENRPGRHGLWQRPVERRRLSQAPLLLTWSPRALEGAAGLEGACGLEGVVVSPVVEPSGPPAAVRDVAAVAYAADPVKRRLDVIVGAWGRARREGETLWVVGIEQAATPWAAAAPPGVRFAGRLETGEYRALLRRARVFVAAPRREDFGLAPLEALADGAMVVTTPAAGPYPALGLARELDRRLVADDLAPALRAALDDPLPGYAERAARLVAPYGRAAVAQTISADVLPRLLPGFQA